MGLVEATVNLASVFQAQGAEGKAQELLEEARSRGDEDASFNLACNSIARVDFCAARELFDEARQRGHKQAAVKLAAVCIDQGDVHAAREILVEEGRIGNADAEEYLNFISSPDLPKMFFNQAALCLRQGETSRARALFEQARAHGDPDAGDVLSAMSHATGKRTGEPQGSSSSQGPSQPRQHPPSVTVHPTFKVGDRVFVHGLKSSGIQFNFRFATVVKNGSNSGRYAVDIDGVEGVWAMKVENLVPESLALECGPLWQPLNEVAQEEDILGEAGAGSAGAMGDANAQLSNSLLANRGEGLAPAVVLLTFSRSPRSFRTILAEAVELAAYRDALAQNGCAWELKSGTKIFVKPDHYEPTLEAVRSAGWSLARQHIIVDVELAEVVPGLLRCLPGRESVRSQGAVKVPLAFAAASLQFGSDIVVSKTFINIRSSSSMCSADGTGQRTKSTTDADPRKGKNKRKGKTAVKGSGA